MQNCDRCTKKNLWTSTKKEKEGRRLWKCRNCGHLQYEEPPQGLAIPPKVFYFDIETSLMKVEYDTFSLKNYQRYIPHHAIAQDFYIICWAGAWVNDNKKLTVIGDCVTQNEAVQRNDKRIVNKLRDYIDEADYIVGHNMRKFDWKKTNFRIIKNKIPPPAEAKIMDTYLLGRRKFAPPSDALEYWSLQLDGNPKDDMYFRDWKAIQDTGDKKALKKMYKYCKGDIREGVNLWLKLRDFFEASTGKPLCT